jgi:uncharacterized protein (TIGR02145 family)
MKKFTYILSSLFCLSLSQSIAQDTLVVMKAGQAVYKRVVTEVDSIIFKPKTTISNPTSLTDIDGNVYPITTIGTQTWMGENLRVEKYNDGTAIPLVSDNAVWAANQTKLPMMAWYNNDKATHTANKNGALYNFYAVDTKKLCPTGWHVPTDAEWTTLTTYLGGEAGAGKKLKSTSGWSGVNGTNEVNFTALPGGYRDFGNGAFYNLGSIGYWWSASASGTSSAWSRGMSLNNGNVYRSNSNQENGLSVRCLRD